MPDTTSTLTVRIDADMSDLRDQLSDAAKLGTKFGSALSSAFADITLRGRGLSDVLRTLALRLSEIALTAAFKPLTDALGGALSGALTGVAFAKGGVIGRPMPVPFAQGGVVASPISFPLGGSQMGIAGERGPEAILPLARGPDGSLGVRAGAGSGLNVTFNVSTPDAESFRRSETQIAALLARAVGQGQRNL